MTVHLFRGATRTGAWVNWCSPHKPGVKQPISGEYLYDEWVIQPQLATCPTCLTEWTKAMPPPPKVPTPQERVRAKLRALLLRGVDYLAARIQHL